MAVGATVTASIEAWARAGGLWFKWDGLALSTWPGWTVQRVSAGIRVTHCAVVGDTSDSRSWCLDAVAAHLWALAVESGETVDVGECSACLGGGVEEVEVANDDWPDGIGWLADAGEACPVLGTTVWSRACHACTVDGEPTGRDTRQLALLMCWGPGSLLQSSLGAAPTAEVVRVWAESQAQHRAIVADARLAWRDTGVAEPERHPDEDLGRLDPRVALRADLARWLLAWLGGAHCAKCLGHGMQVRFDGVGWVAAPEHLALGPRARQCPDCWGTGRLGLRKPIEAALYEWTPKRE